jgi:hypothetical protein
MKNADVRDDKRLMGSFRWNYWRTVDTGWTTMTFYDKAGTEILVEQIS